MIWNIIIVMALVAANGFFVAAEFALVKVRATEIAPSGTGPGGASRLARHMLDHLNAYLSACQLGITLASLGLGWVGEPVVARAIEPLFAALGLPAEKVHFVAFPLAFVIITYLHLTVGEQAPKIAAIQNASATMLVVVYPLALFYTVFKPFIWVIDASSNAVLRLAGLRAVSEHEQTLTEEEVRLILVQAATSGDLKMREQRIMENVLDLEEKIARRSMVPRGEIVYLNRHDPIGKKLEIAANSGHSRFPLCEGDLDHVVGIVHVKDVLGAMAGEGELTTLAGVAREALFLPETIRLDRLLKEFQRSRSHLAILVDEHGSVSGMITLDNVLEEMIGPIEDEFDVDAPRVVKRGEGRFEVDAACPIDEFVEQCGVEVPPDIDVDTVGGVLTSHLGHIPRVGEKLRLGLHELTVLDAQPTRAVRVLVERTGPAQDSRSS